MDALSGLAQGFAVALTPINLFWCLLAFLAAVFTFGAVLAVTVYGIAEDDVLIFGVAANVVAAAGALAAEAVQKMEAAKITSLMITDARGHLAGVIHLQDLLRAGVV